MRGSRRRGRRRKASLHNYMKKSAKLWGFQWFSTFLFFYIANRVLLLLKTEDLASFLQDYCVLASANRINEAPGRAGAASTYRISLLKWPLVSVFRLNRGLVEPANLARASVTTLVVWLLFSIVKFSLKASTPSIN